MSACQCVEDLGDYSLCPNHGIGTAWEKEQLRDRHHKPARQRHDRTLCSAAPAMRDALEAEEYFRANGYTKTSVWKFAGENADHPIWMAFSLNGSIEVQRYLGGLRRAALAAAKGK